MARRLTPRDVADIGHLADISAAVVAEHAGEKF
jgi:hypothetical protein